LYIALFLLRAETVKDMGGKLKLVHMKVVARGWAKHSSVTCSSVNPVKPVKHVRTSHIS